MSEVAHLTLATRGSRLALAQAECVREALCRRNAGLSVDLLVLTTRGDRVLDVPLPEIPGKGLFTREIESALLDGRAQLAAHSLKDLPTELPPGLVLGALTEREDPRDVLVCREAAGLQALPVGAVVGTSSLRRSAQLAHCRPDLHFTPLRGNVETRLRKLAEEGLDAIVLAAAGLRRLGLEGRVTEYLPPEVCLPAAGQGIIAVEARADDGATLGLLAGINCAASQACAAAERAALEALGGGCHTPIGVLARVEGERCVVAGAVLDPSGSPCYRAEAAGTVGEAAATGRKLAEGLLRRGAGQSVAFDGDS